MEEYVKRKDVAEMLENAAIISDGEYSGYCTEDVSLGSIPAADVAPVRQGHWETGDWDTVVCSACGAYFVSETTAEEFMEYSHYCPNCGAKMDGGEQK